MFRIFSLICCFVALQIASMAGVVRDPSIILMLVVILFHVLVVRMPVFPYPKGEVTWPFWRK